jgi:hypothetical protein
MALSLNDYNVSKLYGMLPAPVSGDPTKRTAADNQTVRNGFVKNGEDVIIAGSVSDEAAKKQYPEGWKSPKPYIRIVPQPRG